uniref:B30.2/SPRY domain-containing protein n=1 Tax=Poecilia latipinna TaxID=48699 RepID=A0A3B3V229_9TELE
TVHGCLLKEEDEQKRKTIMREMKVIEQQISSLSDSISAVEEELQKDNVSFLSSYEATQSIARGALIDVKMKDKVHFSPIILDPNTASGWLYLSDDLTRVRRGETKQQLPDNPERNIKYTEIFGSEGFSSGKHSWDVEVGDYPTWHVGVVKESVNRKKRETLASPKIGIWSLLYINGNYQTGSNKTLTVKKSLQRIRIQLDYDMGDVSFFDSEDMTHIYTYRDTFTEKLFPYFTVFKAEDAKSSDIKICETEMILIPNRPERCPVDGVQSQNNQKYNEYGFIQVYQNILGFNES